MSLYALNMIVLGVVPPALLFWARRFEHRADVAHPLGIMAWTLVVAYSLKSVYLAYAVDAGIAFRTIEHTGEILYIGQYIVLAATISLAFGYLIAPKIGFRKRAPKRTRNGQIWTIIYWGLFILCIAALARLFVMKGLHIQVMLLQFSSAKFHIDEETGVQSSLGFLLISADILVVYFLYYITLGGKLLRPSPYVFAIAFVALNYFLSSQRTGVLNIVIGTLIVGRHNLFAIASRSALKRLFVLGIIVAILSFASTIREQRREVSISELSLLSGIESTANNIFEGFYAIDPIKITMIAVRNKGFLYGQSFAMFLIAPVPRILWPEKPIVRIGPYIGQEVLELNNKSGSPPSAVGEFYINFGMAGVTLGMFAFGVLLAMIKQTYLHAPDPKLARVRYALAIMISVYFMIGDFSLAALYIFKYGFAILICEKYWSYKLQRSELQSIDQDALENQPALSEKAIV